MPIADPEKRREYDRARSRRYYQQNREQVIARTRAWQQANPDRVAAYEDAQREKRRIYKTEKQREYDARPGAAQTKRERDRAWRLANPERAWAHSLKRSHGMHPDQWHAMFMEQRGLCYLCERPLPGDRAKVAVDHDHSHCPPLRSCGICRRGLTHHQCNSSIGLLGDDPAMLRLIADNLERAKELTAALIMAAPIQDELPF